MPVLHAARWNGIKCLTPKSPDRNARRMTNGKHMRWTIQGDPDYPPDNKMGWEDIKFGLMNYAFTPGSIILEIRSPQGKTINRHWNVQVRHSRNLGYGDMLDAWCEQKDCDTVLWLTHDVFRRCRNDVSDPPHPDSSQAEGGKQPGE